MPTDRELLKAQQAGKLGTAGAVDAIAEVGKAHQHVFTFEVTSDATMAEIGLRIDKKCIVKSAHFTPSTALAINGTNYVTLDVSKRDGVGGSATVVATLNTNTGGTALSAFQPAALTVTQSAASLAVGNVLTFKSTETGTPTSPIGKCTVVVEYV